MFKCMLLAGTGKGRGGDPGQTHDWGSQPSSGKLAVGGVQVLQLQGCCWEVGRGGGFEVGFVGFTSGLG